MKHLALVIAGSFLLLGSARTAWAAPASQPARVLTLTVVEQGSNTPLPKTPVSMRNDCDQKAQKFVTNDNGVATIPLPTAELKFLTITATAPKHVPTSFTYRADDPAGPQPIPSTLTIPVESGTTIGGIIQDPDGKPIAGATVYLLVPNNKPSGTIRAAIWDHTVKTDATGRWTCDIMPADLPDIWIRLKHKDFASDSMYGNTPRPSIEKLRDGTGVMVMRHGIALTGTVTGPDDKPIPNATVRQGRDRYGTNFPSTKTDAAGHYTFPSAPAGEMILTVQAKGLAPELKSFTIAQGQPPVDFKLSPAHTLKARVVDQSGNPLPGVHMNADTWRGYRTLNFSAETDANGEITWDAAPAETVEFNVSKEGYSYIMRQPLTALPDAAAQPPTVTMGKPLTAHVTVTDADTGQPITHYNAIQGISWGDGNRAISWERRNAAPADHPKGIVDVTFDMIRPGHAVRLEADGYAPVESRVMKDDEGAVTLDIKLKKAANLATTVLTPDGKPAANAEVGLSVPPYNLQFNNGHISEQSDHPVTRTNADGIFSFPPQSGKYKIVVAHDSGSAILTGEEFSASKPIQLKPWAHLDGVVMIGTKPAAGETVYGWYSGTSQPDEPGVYMSVSSTADSAGRFRIDRVPPGEVHIGRQIKLSERMTGYSHSVPVTLAAGQTQSVTIGGTGRPIVGHVLIPADLLARGNWTASRAEIDNLTEMSKLTIPDDVKAMEPEAQKKWYENWRKSPEGKAYSEAQQKAISARRSYPIALKPDGSFRVEDVPAGSYKLSVTLSDLPPGNQCGWGEDLATGSADLTVPEMPTGRSDDPLELPTLTLTPIKSVNVGDLAPDFAVKTLDGHDLKLADYKGKYVLLDFWATWCGPCVAEIPSVRAAHEAFKDNPRFTVISLSLDDKQDAPLKFAAKNDMTWPQGFLGNWSNATLPNTYGVRGIPATFLIAPDGKVLAKNLRGEQLKSEIAKVLGKS